MDDLTEGHRIYAIGDVHGHLAILDAVLARVQADLEQRPHPAPLTIFLGDYGDRGPDTRGVYDRLIGLQGPTVRCLLGNHDSYIEAYLQDPGWFDRTLHWLHPDMGGNTTLASYGVVGATDDDPDRTHANFGAAFPAEHRAFLASCALWTRVGGYVFVHAGIRPGIPMPDQTRDDLIWIREPFLSSRDDFGFKVIHGHTIVPQVEHHWNRIAVDTGAFRTGNLSVLVLEGAEVGILKPQGVVPLPQRPVPTLSRIGSGLKGIWTRS